MSALTEERLAEIEARAQAATFARGQLRHLFAQMVNGSVGQTDAAARGLLGPSIERLEEGAEDVPALAAEVRRLREALEDRPVVYVQPCPTDDHGGPGCRCP